MADENLIRLLEQQTQLMRTMETQMELMQQQITLMSTPSSDAAVGSTLKSSVSVPWPQPLDVETGDPYENMEFFRNRWENYCIATGMNSWGPEKDEIKAGILLNAIGNAAMKKYMDFNLSERDKKKEKSIFIKMEEEIIKKTNIIHSRYVFNIRGQNTDENFDDFLLSVRKLIKPCHYPDTIKEEMLRDRIVVGIRDSKVMSELLRNENLTLDVAINICRSAERASAHVSDLQKVNEVNKISKHVKKEATEGPKKCKFCGNMHVFKKKVCPAWGTRCEGCGGRNHFKSVCKTKGVSVKEIEVEDDSSDDSVYISEVRANKVSGHMEAPLLFKKGEHFSEEFAAINRFQKLPVITHNDFILTESIAIVRYLANQNLIPESVYPRDLKQQARVDEFLEWHHIGLRLYFALYFRYKHLNPILSGKPADPKTVAKHERYMEDSLEVFATKWLGNGTEFVAGDTVTVADLFATCELEQPRMAGFDPFDKYDVVSAWYDKVRAHFSPYYEEGHVVLNKVVKKQASKL